MKKTLRTFLLLIVVLVLGSYVAFGQYVWTKDARNPVLTGGGSGTWNKHVFNPCVLFNSDSARYEMWFQTTPGPLPGLPWSVGFAVSQDGANWTIYLSAVMTPTPGTWDQMTIGRPCVLREEGAYKMWYGGYASLTTPNYIGFATSTDGIHWTKYAGNPIFGPGSLSWEAGGPLSACVRHGGRSGPYRMWYVGYNQSFDTTRIGYAESWDGITWDHRDTLPNLDLGVAGQWDSRNVGCPIVMVSGNEFVMVYSGEQVAGGAWKACGVATSATGTNWTRHTGNPLFMTTPGSWDETYAGMTTMLLVGDTLHAWYDGIRSPLETNLYRIGHATSPLVSVGVNDRDSDVPQHFALSHNYPNPFNPTTTISYQVPSVSHVKLCVFDLLGREVAVLVNETRNAGRYEVRFDGAGLASGLYLCRLHAGDFTQTRKLVLVR